MKIWIAAIAMISLAGLVAADDLEDSYAKLKTAVASKNVEQVKSASAQTLKLARVLVNAPKPAAAADVSDWQQRVDYGKEVEGYTE
ncbi:MAG: hypothetical protein ACRD30_05005, partial [Bryobacteraceae bacterium]